MILFLKWIHLLSIAVWLGAMVFFSLFAAPTVFKTLSEEAAGPMITALFSRYYFLNTLCGTTAVVTAILLGFRGEGRSFLEIFKTAILMVMLALALYAGFNLRGQILEVKGKIREKPPQETLVVLQERFDRLHHRSVLINATILAGGALAFLLTAIKLRL